MNEPLNLAEIGVHYLSKSLIPITADEDVYIPELSCLSKRIGNLLLKKIIECKRINSWESNDSFLSLFNNIAQEDRVE